MENKVISIFAIVCLAIVVYLWFNPKIEYEIKTKIEIRQDTVRTTTVDTVWVNKIDSVFIDVPIPSVTEDSLNKYESPVKTDYFTGMITSFVRGELINQEFDYTFRSEQITRIDSVIVEREITNTITRTHYPTGLYFGAQSFNLGTNASVGPSLMFVRRQNAFGYSYDPFNNTHNLNIHFRW